MGNKYGKERGNHEHSHFMGREDTVAQILRAVPKVTWKVPEVLRPSWSSLVRSERPRQWGLGCGIRVGTRAATGPGGEQLLGGVRHLTDPFMLQIPVLLLCAWPHGKVGTWKAAQGTGAAGWTWRGFWSQEGHFLQVQDHLHPNHWALRNAYSQVPRQTQDPSQMHNHNQTLT